MGLRSPLNPVATFRCMRPLGSVPFLVRSGAHGGPHLQSREGHRGVTAGHGSRSRASPQRLPSSSWCGRGRRHISPAYARLSEDRQIPEGHWLQKHPHTRRPPCWLLHYRLVGAVQRSDNRKLVVRMLEHKLVPAGAKPPPVAILYPSELQYQP